LAIKLQYRINRGLARYYLVIIQHISRALNRNGLMKEFFAKLKQD